MYKKIYRRQLFFVTVTHYLNLKSHDFFGHYLAIRDWLFPFNGGKSRSKFENSRLTQHLVLLLLEGASYKGQDHLMDVGCLLSSQRWSPACTRLERDSTREILDSARLARDSTRENETSAKCVSDARTKDSVPLSIRKIYKEYYHEYRPK